MRRGILRQQSEYKTNKHENDFIFQNHQTSKQNKRITLQKRSEYRASIRCLIFTCTYKTNEYREPVLKHQDQKVTSLKIKIYV